MKHDYVNNQVKPTMLQIKELMVQLESGDSIEETKEFSSKIFDVLSSLSIAIPFDSLGMIQLMLESYAKDENTRSMATGLAETLDLDIDFPSEYDQPVAE